MFKINIIFNCRLNNKLTNIIYESIYKKIVNIWCRYGCRYIFDITNVRYIFPELSKFNKLLI